MLPEKGGVEKTCKLSFTCEKTKNMHLSWGVQIELYHNSFRTYHLASYFRSVLLETIILRINMKTKLLSLSLSRLSNILKPKYLSRLT